MKTRSQTSKYKIYKNAMQVTQIDIDTIKQEMHNESIVFNPDRKRMQFEITRANTFICKIIKYLHIKLITKQREINSIVVLHSYKGCKKQRWHTDFDPELCTRARVMPLSVLIALQDDTRLYILAEQINLNKGDILVFDEDLIHAGADYSCENTRIHMYLDSKCVKREHNNTYLH